MNQLKNKNKMRKIITEMKAIIPKVGSYYYPLTYEGQKGYTMDSLIKYLNAIDKDIFLSVEKRK